MEEFNSGLILEQKSIRDWVAGGFTPLTFGANTTGGDWSEYLPEDEYQNRWGYDRMACVSFATLNCIEILYKHKTGIKRNFSDRFLAQMSHTGRQGNSLSNVFDTMRKVGLVDENRWPDVQGGWEEYYKEIPQEIQNEALEILNTWDFYREWVVWGADDIYKNLMQAPLVAILKYAEGNDVLSPTGQANHAVTIYNAEKGKWFNIFDHYTQTRKRYAWDYNFEAVLKPTLIRKNIMPNFKKDHAYQLVQGYTQKTGLFVENKGLYIGESIDVLVNSAMRLKLNSIPTPIPTTLTDWQSVDHYTMKGEKI